MSAPRVIILGAGEGSRLRPMTSSVPKCLAPLAGRPLMAHQISRFQAAGLHNISVVAGYRREQVEKFARDRDIFCVHNPDYATTNMVATLFAAEGRFPIDQDLIVSYGDIVFDDAVLASLLECRHEICVSVDLDWRDLWSLRMEDPLADAETLKFGPDGRLREIGKRPTGYQDIEGQYLGLVKVRTDRIEKLRAAYHAMDRDAIYDGKDFDNMYMTSFLQHLIDTGWRVQGAPVQGGWLEIDTVDDLEVYETMHRRGELKKYIDL